MSAPPKDPRFVESGRRGARKRWAGHDPRVVRLDDLTADQRRLVVALVDAARSVGNEKAVTEVQSPVTAEPEGVPHDSRPAA